MTLSNNIKLIQHQNYPLKGTAMQIKKKTLYKKWSFPLRICPVNVTQSTENCHRKLRIWSHLLEKSLMENFIFCSVKPLINHFLGFEVTGWKVFKDGVFSGPYFPVFTLYLDTFHTLSVSWNFTFKLYVTLQLFISEICYSL